LSTEQIQWSETNARLPSFGNACVRIRKKEISMKSENYFGTEAVVESISEPGHRVDGLRWIVGRMRVPGGWLVTNAVHISDHSGSSVSLSTIFVSDPDAGWVIDNLGFMHIAAEASRPQ
jgi:hypothetical protein